MARQKGNHISGAVGPVIFYRWRGIDCVRARPLHRKQTGNSRRTAGIFGAANTITARLRAGLAAVLPPLGGQAVQYRVARAVRQFLAERADGAGVAAVPFLDQLEVNEAALLSQHFRKQFPVTWERGRALIEIPAIDVLEDFRAPKGTHEIFLDTGVVAVALNDHRSSSAHRRVTLPFTGGTVAAQQVELATEPFHNAIYVAAIGIRYASAGLSGPGHVHTEPRWLPCRFVSAWQPDGNG